MNGEWFKYYLIRYTPNAIRGEFINVGVVIDTEDGKWVYDVVHHKDKAVAIGGSGASDELHSLLRGFTRFSESPDAPLDFVLASLGQSRECSGEIKLLSGENLADRLEGLMQKLVR